MIEGSNFAESVRAAEEIGGRKMNGVKENLLRKSRAWE